MPSPIRPSPISRGEPLRRSAMSRAYDAARRLVRVGMGVAAFSGCSNQQFCADLINPSTRDLICATTDARSPAQKAWAQRAEAMYAGLSNYFVDFTTAGGASARLVNDPSQVDPVANPGQRYVLVSEGQGFAMKMANDLGKAEDFHRFFVGMRETLDFGLPSWRGDLQGVGTGKAKFIPFGESGRGSATDADMDIAFELIRAFEFAKAGKPGYKEHLDEYAFFAQYFLDQIWNTSVYYDGEVAFVSISSDEGRGSERLGTLTSPSYFSVAQLEAFDRFDGRTRHRWDVAATTQQQIRVDLVKQNGKLIPGFVVVGRNSDAEAANGDRFFFLDPQDNAKYRGSRYDNEFNYDAIRAYWRIAYDAKNSLNLETRAANIALARQIIDELGENPIEAAQELKVYSSGSHTWEPEPQMVSATLTALAYAASLDAQTARTGVVGAGEKDYGLIFQQFSDQVGEQYHTVEGETTGYFRDPRKAHRGDREEFTDRYSYYPNAVGFLSAFVFSETSPPAGVGRYVVGDAYLEGKEWQAVRDELSGGSASLAWDGAKARRLGFYPDPDASNLHALAEQMRHLEGEDPGNNQTQKDRNVLAGRLMEFDMADEAVRQYTINLTNYKYSEDQKPSERFAERAAERLVIALGAAGMPQREMLARVDKLVEANPDNPYVHLVRAEILLNTYQPDRMRAGIAEAEAVYRDPRIDNHPRLILKAYLLVMEGYRKALEAGVSFEVSSLGNTETTTQKANRIAVVAGIAGAADKNQRISWGDQDAARAVAAYQTERQGDLQPQMHFIAGGIFALLGDTAFSQPEIQIKKYQHAAREFTEAIERDKKGDNLDAVFALARTYRSLGGTYARNGNSQMATEAFAASKFLVACMRGEANVTTNGLVLEETAQAARDISSAAAKKERAKLREKRYLNPPSLIALNLQIEDIWRAMQNSSATPAEQAQVTTSVTAAFYTGRLRPRLERVAYYLNQGEIENARQELVAAQEIAGVLQNYLNQPSDPAAREVFNFGSSEVFSKEEYIALRGLVAEVRKEMQATGDMSAAARKAVEAKDKLSPDMLAALQRGNGPARAFAALSGFTASGSAIELLSKLESTLDRSVTLSRYGQRLRIAEEQQTIGAELARIRAEVSIINGGQPVADLLAERKIGEAQAEIDALINACRYTRDLGEEPYVPGQFEKAVDMVMAYAQGLANQGKLDEAQAIYRLLGGEESGRVFDAETEIVLDLLRDRETSGSINLKSASDGSYKWKINYWFGSMVLETAYLRGSGTAEMQTLINEGIRVLGEAQAINPLDSRPEQQILALQRISSQPDGGGE